MREHNAGRADRAAEDYVVAIASLGVGGKAVIGARLAEYFGVAPPTVTQTLHRLRDHGYVQIEASKNIALTDIGRALARGTLRRRRLAERFFVDGLGMSVAEAEAEADRVEHVLSDEVVERLNEALGDPDVCPHGDPIDGEERAVTWIATSLDRAPIGVDLVVERLGGEHLIDSSLLAEIDAAGLRPGVRLTARLRSETALELEGANGSATLSLAAARRVTVRQAQSARRDLAVAQPNTRFHLTVKAVQGRCFAGHRVGDDFVVGHCAPAGLCLDALQRILPTLSALRLGRAAASSIEVPCPEDGIVTFAVEPEAPPDPGPA